MTKDIPLSVILNDITKKGMTPEQACEKQGLNLNMMASVYRDYFRDVYKKMN